jgi:hypothetical protein
MIIQETKMRCLLRNSLFILGFSLITLAANQLSVLAQTRQPTNSEIDKLRQEFQQFIRSTKNNSIGAGYIQDRRTPGEKNTRESFVSAWSKIEPGLAPFMGAWSGYEDIKNIYPSNTKGCVCVIGTGEGYGTFDIGVLSNGVIKIKRGQVLFKEGNFLGLGLFKDGKFVSSNGEIPLHSPRPIEPLTKLLNSISESPDKSQVNKQFKAAGCISTLPNSSENRQPQSNTVSLLNTQKLPPALVSAIRQDFSQYREDFSSYFRDSKIHRVFFVDLNNDNVKEAILYPGGGSICSNRSCPIYIYVKVGNDYKRISDINSNQRFSSTIYGSRNEPSIGVLTTTNQGWRDIVTRLFDYETRTEKWSRVRYGNSGYVASDQVIVPTPTTILEYSSGIETDFIKFLSP